MTRGQIWDLCSDCWSESSLLRDAQKRKDGDARRAKGDLLNAKRIKPNARSDSEDGVDQDDSSSDEDGPVRPPPKVVPAKDDINKVIIPAQFRHITDPTVIQSITKYVYHLSLLRNGKPGQPLDHYIPPRAGSCVHDDHPSKADAILDIARGDGVDVPRMKNGAIELAYTRFWDDRSEYRGKYLCRVHRNQEKNDLYAILTDEGKKAFNAKAMALRETRRTSVALAYLRGKASLIYDSVKDMKAEGKDLIVELLLGLGEPGKDFVRGEDFGKTSHLHEWNDKEAMELKAEKVLERRFHMSGVALRHNGIYKDPLQFTIDRYYSHLGYFARGQRLCPCAFDVNLMLSDYTPEERREFAISLSGRDYAAADAALYMMDHFHARQVDFYLEEAIRFTEGTEYDYQEGIDLSNSPTTRRLWLALSAELRARRVWTLEEFKTWTALSGNRRVATGLRFSWDSAMGKGSVDRRTNDLVYQSADCLYVLWPINQLKVHWECFRTSAKLLEARKAAGQEHLSLNEFSVDALRARIDQFAAVAGAFDWDL